MTNVQSICVYCGSSSRVDARFKETAIALGTAAGTRGIDIVYGGGRVGLMGLVADAALAAGARVIGIIPQHIQELEVQHTDLSELVIVDSMHTRKRIMFERSDAFVILPGGLGTLDETFEILTWKQLALHDKPIVLLDDHGYWQPLTALFEHMITEGFARPEHRSLVRIADSVAGVFEALALEHEPTIPPQAKCF